jgi:hypothetical protein
MGVSQKVNGLFKYIGKKLILCFNVIPLNFNALVPAFQKLFNSIRKKFLGCTFNQFCTVPMSSSSEENLLLLELLSMGQTYGSLYSVIHYDLFVFFYHSFNGLNTVLSP